MTAPLLFASLEPASFSSRFSPCTSDRAGGKALASQRVARPSSNQQRQQPSNAPSIEASPLDLIWSSLLESLQQGVIVTSRSLNPVYWNAKARTLCQHLSDGEFPPLELPAVVLEVCHRVMRENCTGDRPFVMECRTSTGQTIRISARWLYLRPEGNSTLPNTARQHEQAFDRDSQQPYILVLLENCTDLLQEELRIEQRKYDLTDREAEVWMLLRQEYTYLEIARMLQISFNTVKTHVKNVYAKRRSCQGREKFWCCD